jgi:hypothetical protein
MMSALALAHVQQSLKLITPKSTTGELQIPDDDPESVQPVSIRINTTSDGKLV